MFTVRTTLQARHGDSEEAWDMRARRCSGAFASSSAPGAPSDPLAAAVQTYEDALAAVPSSRMVDLYAGFLLGQVGMKPVSRSPHLCIGFRV